MPNSYLELAAERTRLFNQERVRLLGVVNKEVILPGKALAQNPNSLEHIVNVVDMVNLALNSADDDRSELAIRLGGAREFISNLRDTSAHSSESLILRDAERYLWGRTGATELPLGGASKYRDLADLGKFFYDLDKEFSILTGLNFLKSNRKLPFSAMGGQFWWNLGLEDRERLDSASSRAKVHPRPLTYDRVIQRQNEAAQRRDDTYFNPSTGFNPGGKTAPMIDEKGRTSFPAPPKSGSKGRTSFPAPPNSGGKGRASFPAGPPLIRPGFPYQPFIPPSVLPSAAAPNPMPFPWQPPPPPTQIPQVFTPPPLPPYVPPQYIPPQYIPPPINPPFPVVPGGVQPPPPQPQSYMTFGPITIPNVATSGIVYGPFFSP